MPLTYPLHKETWSLVSPKCGKCCDNVAMGDQIEKLPANVYLSEQFGNYDDFGKLADRDIINLARGFAFGCIRGVLESYRASKNTAEVRQKIATDIECVMSGKPEYFMQHKVVCDETNNIPADVANNEISADILFRPPHSECFIVTHAKVALVDKPRALPNGPISKGVKLDGVIDDIIDLSNYSEDHS